MKLTLRGHHLLCLKGFQGYGYDEKFTENMKTINNERKKHDTTIKLTDSQDDICKYCPNLKNNICENPQQNNKIIKMDKQILKNFDLSKEYNSVKLFKQIDDIFNTQESISKICLNCMWHDECLFFQKVSDNR